MICWNISAFSLASKLYEKILLTIKDHNSAFALRISNCVTAFTPLFSVIIEYTILRKNAIAKMHKLKNFLLCKMRAVDRFKKEHNNVLFILKRKAPVIRRRKRNSK